jgi:hypothetical protein
MAKEFAPRIHFAHLRNVTKEPDGSFHEAEHLEGDTDMVEVVSGADARRRRRKAEGRVDWEIPMRPDHGHAIVDDIGKKVNPGYSCIGRLKGLAELRGIMRDAGEVPGMTVGQLDWRHRARHGFGQPHAKSLLDLRDRGRGGGLPSARPRRGARRSPQAMACPSAATSDAIFADDRSTR